MTARNPGYVAQTRRSALQAIQSWRYGPVGSGNWTSLLSCPAADHAQGGCGLPRFGLYFGSGSLTTFILHLIEAPAYPLAQQTFNLCLNSQEAKEVVRLAFSLVCGCTYGCIALWSLTRISVISCNPTVCVMLFCCCVCFVLYYSLCFYCSWIAPRCGWPLNSVRRASEDGRVLRR